MRRLSRAPSPALALASVALFVGLGGGAALASGLISGKKIVDHSIPAKKLTAAAVKALHGERGPAGPQGPKGDAGAQGPKGDTGATGPQGPGALSFNKGAVPADGGQIHLLTEIDNMFVTYWCNGAGVGLAVAPAAGDMVFASGDKAEDGTLTSVQASSSSNIFAFGTSTANLDVVAWVGSNGTLSRVDLGGFQGAGACNIWGVVTPGSTS